MGAGRIPEDLVAAIRKAWPDDVVEEFPPEESYFHRIRHSLAVELAKIPGASLEWQTEERESPCLSDDVWDDPPPYEDWQSYHVFFVAPRGDEFHFEDETEGMSEPEDADEEPEETTIPGEGWIGWAVAVSLVARVAVLSLTSHSRYEDGSFSLPDVQPDGSSEGEINDAKAARKLEQLRARILSILKRRRIQVLEGPVLALPVPGLSPGEDVFLEKPLRVFDAFFFRGV